MDGITDICQYLLGVVAVIVLPGPNSLYCLSVAGQHGIKKAFEAIAGVVCGDGVLMLATILGAGTVLRRYPALTYAVQLAGSLYLAWMGLGLLKAAWSRWHNRSRAALSADAVEAATAVRGKDAKNMHVFYRAIGLSLTNPKAIIFFLSFFVQFVKVDAPSPIVSFSILALIAQLVSFLYLGLLAFAGAYLVRFFTRSQLLASVGTGMVGVLFIGFAVQLMAGSL